MQRQRLGLWNGASALAGQLGLLFLLASPIGAQEIIQSYLPDVWKKQNSYAALDLVDDLDGDGYGEFVLGDGAWPGSPSVPSGKVLVLSGATGTPLYTYAALSPVLGLSAAHLGDTTGDGVSEVAASADVEMFVWSGSDGSVVCQLPSPPYDSIARLGDINGDGLEDYAAGVGTYIVAGGGFVDVWLGGSCAGPHYTVSATPGTGWFGSSIATLGDVNGDGVPDFAVGARGDVGTDCARGYVGVYSGVDGSLVWEAYGETNNDAYGRSLAAPGDFTGDGIVDLVVSAPKADGEIDCKLGGPGRLYFHDGATGAPIDRIIVDDSAAFFGLALGSVGDVNGNGVGDVLATITVSTSSDDHAEERLVWLIEGATREVIYAISSPYGSENQFGIAMVGIGDWDGDDFPDFALGSPSAVFTSGVYPGHLDLYSGAPIGVESYGSACATASGDVPRIGTTGSPAAGKDQALHLSRVPPGLSAILGIGFSKSSWLGTPLPIDLGLVGMTGCELLLAPSQLVAAATSAVSPGEGAATVDVSIPADGALVGSAFYAQWLVLNPPGSPSPGATTRALSLTIQQP